MSTTFSFVCDDCKKSCWAGQGAFIYKYSYIADFLHDHVGHNLRFLNDHSEDERSESYEPVAESDACRAEEQLKQLEQLEVAFSRVKAALELIRPVPERILMKKRVLCLDEILAECDQALGSGGPVK